MKTLSNLKFYDLELKKSINELNKIIRLPNTYMNGNSSSKCSPYNWNGVIRIVVKEIHFYEITFEVSNKYKNILSSLKKSDYNY